MIFNDIEKSVIAKIATLPYDWNRLKHKTVFISGGTGFIGSHLVALLEERNKTYNDHIRIISLSRKECKNTAYTQYVTADIREPLKLKVDVDYIIHLASNTHPVQYAADPVGTITTNILGCHNLLEFGRKKQIDRFLLASSVEIYGNGTETPFKESDCGYIDCNTARAGYNESKRVSESLCQSYRSQYGVDCVIARLARVFGADRKEDSKALAQFMEHAIKDEDIVLKSKGKQRFSYCYIMDAVSGLVKVLLDGKCASAYNISADDDGKNLGDIAKYIAGLAGRQILFDLKEVQEGISVSDFALLDNTKLKKIGWVPLYSVEQGLKETFCIKRSLKV